MSIPLRILEIGHSVHSVEFVMSNDFNKTDLRFVLLSQNDFKKTGALLPAHAYIQAGGPPDMIREAASQSLVIHPTPACGAITYVSDAPSSLSRLSFVNAS